MPLRTKKRIHALFPLVFQHSVKKSLHPNSSIKNQDMDFPLRLALNAGRIIVKSRLADEGAEILFYVT